MIKNQAAVAYMITELASDRYSWTVYYSADSVQSADDLIAGGVAKTYDMAMELVRQAIIEILTRSEAENLALVKE